MPLKSLTWKSGLAVKLISKSPEQTGGYNRCYPRWQTQACHTCLLAFPKARYQNRGPSLCCTSQRPGHAMVTLMRWLQRL